MAFFVVIILLLAVMWLLLIRPQRQRQAAHRRLLDDLQTGDEVVTLGGIIGRVTAIEDDRIALEIAPGTDVKVAKQAVTGVLGGDGESAAPAEARG